jgi:hypothetical protein
VLLFEPVPAGEPVHVQTLGVCAAVPPGTAYATGCPNQPAAPGGSTLVRFTFFPDNADGDGVADTLDACPQQVGSEPNGCPPPDRDGDAIPDAADACADAPGVAPNGCPPDTDGDGFANAVDDCPFQVGVAPRGCPADPDPDRDGIPVQVDSCPTQAGTAADGCPDSDGDRVSDRVDRCRDTRGDKADGCPSAIAADVVGQWQANRRTTKMLSLRVRAPVGVKIVVMCSSRHKDCRFGKRTLAKTKERTTRLTSWFGRKRVFDPGTTITVRVTLAARIGTYEKLTMRAGRRLPRVTQRCVDAGGRLTRCA